MSCNTQDFEIVNSNPIVTHYRLNLDQDTATDVATIAAAAGSITSVAGGAGAAIAAIVNPIVGGAIAGVTAVIVSIIVVEWAWIQTQANGCGVTIDYWAVNDLVDPFDNVPYHNITPQ